MPSFGRSPIGRGRCPGGAPGSPRGCGVRYRLSPEVLAVTFGGRTIGEGSAFAPGTIADRRPCGADLITIRPSRKVWRCGMTEDLGVLELTLWFWFVSRGTRFGRGPKRGCLGAPGEVSQYWERRHVDFLLN